MAGRDPLNSIADLAALQAEADRVIAVIRGIDEAVKSVSEIKSVYKNASNSAEQKKASEDLVQANKQVEAAQKQLNAETQKSVTLTSELGKQIAIVKEQNKERQKTLTAEAREAAGLTDAYKKLELQYAAAAREAKNLAAQSVQNPNDPGLKVRADNAAREANALNEQLKRIDGSMGEHRRKVGDYIGAISTLTPVLDEIKGRMDKLTQSGETNSAEFTSLKEQYESLSVIVGQASTGFTSLTMQIRAGEKALQTMRAAELENTEEFKQLRIQVANAHREFNEFNNQQRLLENHAPGLKALTIAAKGLGGAYALSAGAVALFGDEEGKIEKETQKLIAIMTILQGLNEVAELIQQRKAIALAFETNLTKIAAVAQKAWAAVTLESAAATTALRISIGLLTGGLLLLLPLTASAFSMWAKSIKDARREEELMNEVNEKAIDGYAGEIINVQLLTKELQNENFSREQKMKWIDDLQHKYPEILGNIKNEGELTEDLSTAIKDKLIPALELEAKAKAAVELATEKYKKLLQAQLDVAESGKTSASQWKNAIEVFAIKPFAGGLFTPKLQEDMDKIKELQKEIDGLFSISTEATEELQKLGKIEPTGIKTTIIDITKEIEARSKLIELVKQQQIELTKAFSESQESPEFSRVKALQKAYELEKQIIQNRSTIELQLNTIEQQKIQHDLQERLTTEKHTAQEIADIKAQAATNERALELQRKAIVLQTNDDLFKAAITYNTTRGKIHADTLAQIVDDEKKTKEELEALDKTQADLIKIANEKRIAYIEEARDFEITALNKKYAEGKITEQQYQDQRKKLETDADIFILKARQDLLKLDIDKTKAAGKDPTILEAQYANLERQINDKKNQAKIESDKAIFEKKKELKQQEIELEKKAAEQVEQTVDAFVKGAFERQLNSIQDQIDANTKLKDAEVTRINQSTLSEQDKAAKLAQLAQQTQANNDQLAAKQKDIRLKEAKFDRDSAILNILIATGQAVAKSELQASILASNPATAALAATALAQVPIEIEIGAAQIAAIFAKPLPKYATGTTYAPGGPSIVGELGPELRIEPTGEMSITPGKPTLTNLLPGTKIIPHDELNKMMLNMMLQNTAAMLLPKKQDETAKEIRGLKQIIQWQHQELIQAWARIAEKNRTIIKPNYKDFGKDYI